MARKLTVVLSQAPGKHPAKRTLEEDLAAALLFEPGVDLSIVPNLYDLGPDHTGRLFLESVRGDMLVVSWLYPRAAFWLLDRIGVQGQFGETFLKPAHDDDEGDDDTPVEPKETLDKLRPVPPRFIYTLDFRDANQAGPFVAEIRRVIAEIQARVPAPAMAPVIQLGLPTKKELPAAFAPEQLLAPAHRRWYPVIDYSRCTNCLECLDFCLFGVYGVDSFDRIVTENQDQCKKGCPACSRVCPEQAIIFPEYKSATIAGADTGAAVGGLKIDLSKLFGGGEVDGIDTAVAERDRELLAAGRDAVGATVGMPKRQAGKPAVPKDDLDKLVDDLDALGL
jgi:NAD-dependent dihydropyrimidine dehydrogenase PreA subunit